MDRMDTSGAFDLRPISRFLEKKSLGDRVFENLRKAIVRGDIEPGSRMVESRIAGSMGISRTPVREALHRLEQEGHLKRLFRGGFVVLGLGRRDIEETFGIRSVLESYAARLSAIKHEEKDLIPLQQKIAEYERFLGRKDLESLTRINTEFHDLLYALSRSPRLIKMINDLRDQIFRFRRIILRDETLARISNEDHKQMLEYIRKRDAEKVERLVKDHIVRGCTAVLSTFDGNHAST
jgi:DNA-binding GntR family transcriptional regulator